jgi:hypothetical protein
VAIHRRLGTLASTLMLGLPGLWVSQDVAAQAVSYTAKQIKAPSGIRRTCPYDAHLSDSGDMASVCYFRAGYTLVDLGNGIPIVAADETGRPVSWPAATSNPIVLKSPPEIGVQSMMVHGMDKQGNILAGGLYDGRLYWYNKSGVAKTWTPAGAGRTASKVGALSPSGQALIEAVESGGNNSELLLVQGEQSRVIPKALVTPYYWASYGLNDVGQIAVCMSNASSSAMRFWDGQQWSDLKAPPAFATKDLCVRLTMAENGAIYMSDYAAGGMHIWRHPAAAPDQAPEFVPGPSAVSPNGTLFGTATFPSASNFGRFGKQRAAIWVNGTPLDVNTLVKPPFLQKFVSVTQMNQVGQFSATAASTLLTSSTWLISPKK